MSKPFMDSRELGGASIFGHRFSDIGQHPYGSASAPELRHEIRVDRERTDDDPVPLIESVGVYQNVAGSYALMDDVARPLVIPTKTTVVWQLFGDGDDASFDTVADDPEAGWDSRTLRPNDWYAHFFWPPGKYTWEAYALRQPALPPDEPGDDDGDDPAEGSVTTEPPKPNEPYYELITSGVVLVSLPEDNDPQPNPDPIELDDGDFRIPEPPLEVTPGTVVTWEIKAGTWYLLSHRHEDQD